ncbi:MAG: hypothetical protein P4N41_10730 [Negativicutes bacterium]|nr:hypothetical protein [Negativicutes bacterium]
MTLKRYLAVAFIVFVVGAAVLYSGLNRAPFRYNGHVPGHKHDSSRLETVLLTQLQPIAVSPERSGRYE